MKKAFTFFLSMLAIGNLSGQLLNSEFDNWTTIDTSGQPYQDLLSWNTNNEGLGNGFSTTPNVRIEEGFDIGVGLMSSYSGIDGTYSGIIDQTIRTEGLIDISYLSKCDSIYEQGACVVNIYDASEMLVFTDSIRTSEPAYSIKRIELSDLPNLQSEKIRLQFVAFGQRGPFEAFQAYSEFNILNANANYISSTKSEPISEIKVFPNPFHSTISIEDADHSRINYFLINASGEIVLQGDGNEIETKDLPKGHYLMQLQTKGEVITKKLVKI